MGKEYYVYIMTNKMHTVLYVGVTNNLALRAAEHKGEVNKGFTKRYHVHELVYCESCGEIKDAIQREKQIKAWRRDKKEQLIESLNPEWRDLSRED